MNLQQDILLSKINLNKSLYYKLYKKIVNNKYKLRMILLLFFKYKILNKIISGCWKWVFIHILLLVLPSYYFFWELTQNYIVRKAKI